MDRCPIDMPSDAEMRILISTVHRALPQLARSVPRSFIVDLDNYLRGFEAAFTRIAYLKRTPAPDKKHYLSWHIDECRQWLDACCIRWQGDVNAAYLTAIVAAGDICFHVGNPSVGQVWEIGVSAYDGRLATAAWRDALVGKLMSPTPARRFA
jgi:hypothetical protein